MLQVEKQVIETEVCIVGAGPAGSTASLFLSKQGIPHVLLDRESFPREKICGEYFDGRVNAVLKKISPELLPQLVENQTVQENWRYALVTSGGKPFYIEFPKFRTPRLQSRRFDFDYALLQKAVAESCARFLPEFVVLNLKKMPPGEGWLVEARDSKPSVRAKIVIVACGSDSNLPARCLGDERAGGAGLFLFMRAHFRLKKQLPENTTFAFIEEKPFEHCFYVSPLPGNAVNVEIALEKSLWQKRGKPDLREMFFAKLADCQLLSPYFEDSEILTEPRGSAIHLYRPAKKFSGEGFLLAGEVAFSSNPITGAGVGQAMTMGMAAAQISGEAVRANDFSAARLSAFDKKIRSLFKRDFRLGRLLTVLQRWPRLVNFVFSVLTVHPRISKWLSKLL